MTGYKWKPIEDIPGAWYDLFPDDLSSLSVIWNEQKQRLSNSSALKRFNTQLQRQWAIETGIIEGLYKIDRGITRLLIEQGIDSSLIPHGSTNKPVEKIIPLIRDQENVIEGLFDFVGQNHPLTTSYIKQVHQALTEHQDTVEAVDTLGRFVEVTLERGVWKKTPNNPTRPDGTLHEYCPPEHVASEMDRLMEFHTRHMQQNVPPEIEAAWLHHRFAQIHPFQDGNGRVARALASLVFLRAGWFPLVIVSDEHRDEYIGALGKADAGDLSTLVEFFTRLEKSAFVKALSICEDVMYEKESMKALIKSAAERLNGRRAEKARSWKGVFTIAQRLEQTAVDFLEGTAKQLQSELEGVFCSVDRPSDTNTHWFWNQVIDIANEFGYYADLRTYHRWLRLKIREDRQTEIILSFHPPGREFVGVMAVSALVEHRAKDEDGETRVDGPYVICRELFEFSYNQDTDAVLTRFEKWLGTTILKGLDHWRRQL